jgi:hypothetical protein
MAQGSLMLETLPVSKVRYAAPEPSMGNEADDLGDGDGGRMRKRPMVALITVANPGKIS